MQYDFDPSGEEHPDSCYCHCCELADMEAGMEQAQQMLDNMRKYGTIDAPKEKSND